MGNIKTEAIPSQKKTCGAIDIAKLFFAFCVVGIHTGLFWDFQSGFYLKAVILRAGVPFFFLCSGYFVIPKDFDNRNLASGLIRRAKGMCIPYLLWNLFYIPATAIRGNNFTIIGQMSAWFMTLTGRSQTVMWYVGALFWCMFFLYLSETGSKKRFQWVVVASFAAYLIGLLFNTYAYILYETPLEFIQSFLIATFRSNSSALFCGYFYYSLGYYLRHYGEESLFREKALQYGLLIVGLLVQFVECYVVKPHLDVVVNYEYYIGQAFSTPALFLILQRLSEGITVSTKPIRKLSTWVYYSHIAVIFLVEYIQGWIPGLRFSGSVSQWLFICAVTSILCMLWQYTIACLSWEKVKAFCVNSIIQISQVSAFGTGVKLALVAVAVIYARNLQIRERINVKQGAFLCAGVLLVLIVITILEFLLSKRIRILKLWSNLQSGWSAFISKMKFRFIHLKIGQILLLLGCILTAACIISGCMRLYKLKNNSDLIVITAQSEQDKIVFRGAMADEIWYNPDDILVSNNGWVQNPTDLTYTSNGTDALIIKNIWTDELYLAFSAGPSYGAATIEIRGTTLKPSFKMEAEVELGTPYPIPGELTTSNAEILDVNAAVLIASTALFALFLTEYLKCRIIHTDIKKTRTVRNAAVEFYRFLVIICVCTYHYCNIPAGGYLGVDFFFVLSGFLLMKQFESHYDGTEPIVAATKYTLSRYFKIFPYYLIAALTTLLVCCYADIPISFDSFLDGYIGELLMLHGFGLAKAVLVAPGWFCSSLLIASFCVYYCLAKWKKHYLRVIAPLGLLLILSYITGKVNCLNHTFEMDTLVTTGTLRGFAELGLGCLCYQVYIRIKEKYKGEYRLLSTAIELICTCLMYYIAFVKGPSPADFICVLIMAVLIVSLFMGDSYLAMLLNNRISVFWGKISISIFLLHDPLRMIDWTLLFTCLEAYSVWTYVLCVILYAIIVDRIIENLTRICLHKKQRGLNNLAVDT